MSQNSVSSVILRFSLDEDPRSAVNVKGLAMLKLEAQQDHKVTRTVGKRRRGLNAGLRLARAKSIDKIEAAAISAGKKTDDWYASLKMVSEELTKSARRMPS